MTQPPFEPTSRAPGDATPTEPVPMPDPALAPPPAPGVPSGGPFAFAPVEPGPGAFAPATGPGPAPDGGWTAPVAPLGPVAAPAAQRSGSGSSRVLTVVLGAALLVAAVGVAFAAGRASAPAAGQVGAAGNAPGFDRGTDPGANGNGPLANGGSRPDSSFDPGGYSGFPGDDDADGFGRGFGRDGVGGLGITGTVTAVTDTSITIRTANGLTLTIGRDGTTTYHQQAPAQASDVTTGDKVEVQVSGGLRPRQGTDGDVSLGTAGDITIVP